MADAAEPFEQDLDDLRRGPPVAVGYEADAAGVALGGGIVEGSGGDDGSFSSAGRERLRLPQPRARCLAGGGWGKDAG